MPSYKIPKIGEVVRVKETFLIKQFDYKVCSKINLFREHKWIDDECNLHIPQNTVMTVTSILIRTGKKYRIEQSSVTFSINNGHCKNGRIDIKTKDNIDNKELELLKS